EERLVAGETAQVLLDRGQAAALAAVVQLDPQQLPQQGFAFRPFRSAEEVLQTRLLPGLPGGLEARADLIDPFGHAQWKGLPPLGSLRSHVLSPPRAPHSTTSPLTGLLRVRVRSPSCRQLLLPALPDQGQLSLHRR